MKTTYCDRVVRWNAVLEDAASPPKNKEARVLLHAALWTTSSIHGPKQTNVLVAGRHTPVTICIKLVSSRKPAAGSLESLSYVTLDKALPNFKLASWINTVETTFE